MVADQKIQAELTVNGKSIPMNEFVHKIVGNLLLAILKSIRLDEEPKNVTFNLKID
jgi:hypothetical protein